MTGLGTIVGQHNTRQTTLKHIGSIRYRHRSHILEIYSSNRTRQIFLLLHAITDYYHFVNHFRIFLQIYIQHRIVFRNTIFLIGISYKRNDNSRIRSHREIEITIQISHRSIGCSFFNHTGTDDRFACGIFYNTGNFKLVCLQTGSAHIHRRDEEAETQQ